MNRFAPPLALLATLATCSGYEEEDAGGPAISATEREALDDAASMIEERRLPDEVLEDIEADGETAEEPAA